MGWRGAAQEAALLLRAAFALRMRGEKRRGDVYSGRQRHGRRRAPRRGPHQKGQSSWNGSAAAAAETAEPARAIAGDRSGWSGATGAAPAQAAVAATKTAAKFEGRAAGGGGGKEIAGIADAAVVYADAALAGLDAIDDERKSSPALLANGDIAAASGTASSARRWSPFQWQCMAL
jgi:hypothetical protein